jgi:hypothetical protein
MLSIIIIGYFKKFKFKEIRKECHNCDWCIIYRQEQCCTLHCRIITDIKTGDIIPVKPILCNQHRNCGFFIKHIFGYCGKEGRYFKLRFPDDDNWYNDDKYRTC